MSPAAVGPHLRATSINGFGPVSTTNGDGVKGTGGTTGGNRVLPHLDDLVGVIPGVDPSASIRKLLEEGEKAAKQAETYLDFKRPDLALQEYIMAFTIAVNYIPQNADYPTLQAERGDLHRMYVGLNKRINSQHSKFEGVKEMVKENNTRSGVKPRSMPSHSNGVHNGQFSNTNNSANGYVNGSYNGDYKNSHPAPKSDIVESRVKPPVQPKPQGLHGKALQMTSEASAMPSEKDLATRFARLRSVQSPVVAQDPRIRTQQIANADQFVSASPKQGVSIVRPLGPREMPTISSKTERPILEMDTSIPSMPRPPDAIYSPARSTDHISTNSLPLLASRGSSYFAGRRDSAISTPKPSQTFVTADDGANYFSPPSVDDNYTLNHHAHSEYDTLSGRTSNELSIPNSTTVSAEQLYEYLKKGSQALSVLLVDVRSREQFDEGHIMTRSIICLEPISLRDDMSAEELGERMVLSPESEQKFYDQKHNFDLVVYYDQSSTSTEMSSTSQLGSNYLKNFSKIIYDHAYDHRLKRKPMLLVGGLDSWIDLFGSNALQSSRPNVPSLERGSKHARPLGRMPVVRDGQVKRRTTRSRTLSAFEEAQWDEALSNRVDEENIVSDDGTVLDEAFYVKTTEDFLRRYPEVPSDKQSMAIPSIPRSMVPRDSIIPAPPTRPPPALPRQRSNGISEKAELTSYAMTGGPGGGGGGGGADPGICGLRNLNGSVCYMNSVLQALSASPGIRNFFIEYQFNSDNCPPAQKDESGPPKQLMTRNLASLLRHLWCGRYNEIVPRMFLRYVNATHARACHADGSQPADLCFGSQRQHDAVEFMGWLLNVLLDEHNMHRNKTGVEVTIRTDDENRMARLRLCRRAFQQSMAFQKSTLLKLVAVQTLTEAQCAYCQAITRRTDSIENTIQLGIPPNPAAIADLPDLLEHLTQPTNQQVDCDACGRRIANNQRVEKEVIPRFSYLPQYLMIGIKRAQFTRRNGAHRDNTPLSFPQQLDMAPYTWLSEVDNQDGPEGGDNYAANVLPEQKPPFIYDCYAVILHRGTNEAGHYWTMARRLDPRTRTFTDEWHEFNDSVVTPGKTFADTQGKGATALFYQRRLRQI